MIMVICKAAKLQAEEAKAQAWRACILPTEQNGKFQL